MYYSDKYSLVNMTVTFHLHSLSLFLLSAFPRDTIVYTGKKINKAEFVRQSKTVDKNSSPQHQAPKAGTFFQNRHIKVDYMVSSWRSLIRTKESFMIQSLS